LHATGTATGNDIQNGLFFRLFFLWERLPLFFVGIQWAIVE
jgi:hypothetical protein